MGLTVSVNHHAFPEGTPFGIDHLGEIPNGGSLEVPEENEAAFIQAHGMTVGDAFPEEGVVSVSGSSSVDNAEELIGDREPPGPAQGVKSEEEDEDEEAPEAESPQQGQTSEATTEVTPPNEGMVS